MRFCPIQTDLGQSILTAYSMPTDVSTAVLIDEDNVAHQNSDSVLRMFQFMGIPYSWLGPVLLRLVPVPIRDFGYRLFARNRGAIWKGVKQVVGLGDTKMEKYRGRILGLEDPLEPSWGFDDESNNENAKNKR